MMWFIAFVAVAGVVILLWDRDKKKAQQRRDEFEKEYGE